MAHQVRTRRSKQGGIRGRRQQHRRRRRRKEIKKASIRGERTALHINSTIMKVKGHGRYSIESQLNVSVMANVSTFKKQPWVAMAQRMRVV
ncbi:hypothetical protein ACNKHW_13090 [Shigella flexneri]